MTEPTPETKPNGSTPPDAYDLNRLWIDEHLSDPLTTEVIHDVPVGPPKDFFRTVPDPTYRRRTEIVILRSENVVGEQYFIVDQAMRGRIDEARPCILVVTVDRAGAPRIWPLKLPNDGERDNPAWTSARAIAKSGMEYWVKKTWRGRAYVERRADIGYAPEPDFTRLKPFDERSGYRRRAGRAETAPAHPASAGRFAPTAFRGRPVPAA
jgi:hypothetical protein